MRIGICLPGGGAKGAFQAGALKRLLECGISPSVVTGTSIGSVNAYFLMMGRAEEMNFYWNNIQGVRHQEKFDKVIDNSDLIGSLSGLRKNHSAVEKVYVNYVRIENRQLYESVIEISKIEKDRALEAVKYSSLLPFNGDMEEDSHMALKQFDSQRVFERFKEDVSEGIYDGWKLDGGILNNCLLAPFISDRVDKIIIIALKDGFLAPEYIFNHYRHEDVFVVAPDLKILPGDTLRFEREYCRNMFNRGYELAGSVCEKLLEVQ